MAGLRQILLDFLCKSNTPDGHEGAVWFRFQEPKPQTSFEQVLKESDIISVHLPLTRQTEMVLNTETLAFIKPGAFLINTARGRILDHSALIPLIKSGRIAGAGLDVFFEQPLAAGSEFSGMDTVVCSPYISSRTYESMARTGLEVVKHILSL